VEIHVPIQPEAVFTLGGLVVTNTLLTSLVILFAIVVFVLLATRNMQLVPGRTQNVAESVVELVLALGEQAGGPNARRFLPLVATLFIYIWIANWMGILPGVGSIPLLRTPNSDLSMTAAMAIIVFFWVQLAGLQANPRAYFLKFVWPPGLNILETISEFTRPLSLALRLFGNILAGFVLVEVMLQIAVSAPVFFFIPSIFLAVELGVGLIQALIFAVLTLAFLSLATSHGHEGAEHSSH
jgi:F-type H+-transporting ATPase subunit a